MKFFNRVKNFAFLSVIIGLHGLIIPVIAQTTSILTAGLNKPTKLITAPDNSLLVAESGTFTPNSGRISIVNRRTGARRTLIDGLPSGVNNLGGPPEVAGPSGLVLQGNIVYLTISVGDAVQNTGGPGIESPNPNPSSPLFDSVLQLNFSGNYAKVSSPFVLSTADHTALANGDEVTLTNADGQKLTLRMVVNLPDYVSNPTPMLPDNVRSSNLYGIETFRKNLYVVDASRNLVYQVNAASGEYDIFTVFANKPNPLFPNLGGPFVEAVPDNIHRVGNQLLVPLLTGFPFVAGLSEVRTVSLKNGLNETFIPNLTSAIDVSAAGENSYYTLEFSANQLANQPGRIKYFASPEAAPVTVVANLISPTSMVLDGDSGDIFVTEIFTGRIIRVSSF